MQPSMREQSKEKITKYYHQCSNGKEKNQPNSVWQPITSKSKDVNVIKCQGTLLCIVTKVHGKVISWYIQGNIPHICHNPYWAGDNQIETCFPLQVVVHSDCWRVSLDMIDNMKTSLSSIKLHWVPLGSCETARQYLKELSTSPSMKYVKQQAEALIRPFIMNVITSWYKSLTYFKVGVIQSRGSRSQFDYMGSLHHDYSDDVNKQVPDEQPQSTLMALDPFNLLYQQSCGGGHVSTSNLFVQSTHAVILTSSLLHLGGANIIIDGKVIPGKGLDKNKDYNTTEYSGPCIYHLFAYVISDEVDYPSEVGTKIELPTTSSDNLDSTSFTVTEHSASGRECQ